VTYEVTTATEGPTADDASVLAVAQPAGWTPDRTQDQLPGTQGVGAGQIGPTCRVMPDFPEPAPLTSHGPLSLIHI